MTDGPSWWGAVVVATIMAVTAITTSDASEPDAGGDGSVVVDAAPAPAPPKVRKAAEELRKALEAARQAQSVPVSPPDPE